MTEGSPTSVRLNEDDKQVIERLEQLTGISGATRVIRMALREALAVWERKRSKK